MKITVKKLVLMGILTAISIVLARMLSIYLTESIRISFGNLPIMLAGIWLGPLMGGLVGGAADVLGATLFSGVGFNPLITIGPILIGIIAGVISKVLALNKCKLWKVVLLVLTIDTIVPLFFTTFALSTIYGTMYLPLLVSRAPIVALSAAVEMALIYPLYKRLGGKIMETDKRAPVT
ncbi:MAG: folate family ECF transporter S component [Eubacteriales bacterium]|nr:folate family ECF transporter S component [Eubacteriales bacterium]